MASTVLNALKCPMEFVLATNRKKPECVIRLSALMVTLVLICQNHLPVINASRAAGVVAGIKLKTRLFVSNVSNPIA
jgi:hypothetical protein